MADIKSPAERSKNMAAIRSKNTKPEMLVRKALYGRGYRYRISSKDIPGHPDIYLMKNRVAIYVHGCFWHRHTGCKYAYMPKSRVDFWKQKFEANVLRDAAVKTMLQEQNIRYCIIWECAIRKCVSNESALNQLIDAVEEFVLSDDVSSELTSDLFKLE